MTHPQTKYEHDSPEREAMKLRKRLRKKVGAAVMEYGMIEAGDRVLVCLSGGKDSYAMLDLLLDLKQVAPIEFELFAVNMDQKQPGFPEHILPKYLTDKGVPFEIIEKDTYSTVVEVVPEGKTMCGLCSRLRRGTLYGYAEDNGFTKIALGHHKDDIVETFFLNLFFHGRISAMPPKLLADDKRNCVIRPLTYIREAELIELAKLESYPIIPCNLCGSQDGLQRQVVKSMLAKWETETPGRVEQCFRALTDVRPSQLADTALFDFANLAIERPTELDGDLTLPG